MGAANTESSTKKERSKVGVRQEMKGQGEKGSGLLLFSFWMEKKKASSILTGEEANKENRRHRKETNFPSQL